MVGTISTKVGSGLFSHLLALWEEGSHDDGARSTQPFATEVGFGHVRLHGDGLAIAEGDGLYRPLGKTVEAAVRSS